MAIDSSVGMVSKVLADRGITFSTNQLNTFCAKLREEKRGPWLANVYLKNGLRVESARMRLEILSILGCPADKCTKDPGEAKSSMRTGYSHNGDLMFPPKSDTRRLRIR